MEEGQNNKFLSKSSIENNEFMTNIVEKKPNIFKRIAMKFSSGKKKPKTPAPEKPKKATPPAPVTPETTPTVPDVAPGAAETPAKAPAPESKNVDPIILIKPDRQSPFASLKNKFTSLSPNKKKTLLIAACAAIFLIIIIIVCAIILSSTKDDNGNGSQPAASGADATPVVIYIDEGEYVKDAKDYSGYQVNDLFHIADNYDQLTEEQRRSDEYINLGYQLNQNVTSFSEKYGYSDVGTILSVVSLAQYYFDNGRIDEALKLTEVGLESTDNAVARFHYYYVAYRYYADHLDFDGAKKYGDIILKEIPEDIVPLAMEEYKTIRHGIIIELEHLEEYKNNAEK